MLLCHEGDFVAGDGVEDGEQFAGEGDEGEFGRFAGLPEGLVEGAAAALGVTAPSSGMAAMSTVAVTGPTPGAERSRVTL